MTDTANISRLADCPVGSDAPHYVISEKGKLDASGVHPHYLTEVELVDETGLRQTWTRPEPGGPVWTRTE